MSNPSVQIDFESTNPPEGTIVVSGGTEAVGFQGWLGLLAELQQIVERLSCNDLQPNPNSSSPGLG
jgi:hypothetical protein